MPLSAASSVLMAFDTLSSRLPRSPARLLSEEDVKKFDGLSSAELTRLPVARRVCVVEIKSDVDCNAVRFERTARERTIPLMDTFLVQTQQTKRSCSVADQDGSALCHLWRRRITGVE